MKESEFNDLIDRINMDTSMDQRMEDLLLQYDYTTNDKKEDNYTKDKLTIIRRFTSLSTLVKAASVLILLAAIGTSTAVMASNIFIHSYTVPISIKDAKDMPKATTSSECKITSSRNLQFGEGIRLFDKDGNILSSIDDTVYDEEGNVIDNSSISTADYTYTPEQNGSDAFHVIGIPDLTPTYLYDHYILDEDGYQYSEKTYQINETKDDIVNSISAHYFTSTQKDVNVQYMPSSGEVYLTTTYYDGVDIENITKSTYETKNGLTCTIINNEGIIDVHIFFNSLSIGNGELMLNFCNIDMDEIKDILDSIPVIDYKSTK